MSEQAEAESGDSLPRGALVIVSTPIGNLGDLSPRAAAALREADLVLAEDTRHSGRLLAEIGAETPLRSSHEHNEDERVPEIVDRIERGETIALISDAGTPGISDPGYPIVRAVADAGLTVTAVPGPAAMLHALVVSGLPTDRFTFDGFLPRKGSARRDRLDDLSRESRTMVLYVSPHRAADDLADLAGALGDDRAAVLCRELTKLHEEALRGTLRQLHEQVASGVRGELTLVVAGAEVVVDTAGPEEWAEDVARRVELGIDRRQAIRDVAKERGVPKREVYQAVVDRRSG